MKKYDVRGIDVWVCDNGLWKNLANASDSSTARFIANVLNEYERSQTYAEQQYARCERYRLRNVQFPPKKKVDY